MMYLQTAPGQSTTRCCGWCSLAAGSCRCPAPPSGHPGSTSLGTCPAGCWGAHSAPRLRENIMLKKNNAIYIWINKLQSSKKQAGQSNTITLQKLPTPSGTRTPGLSCIIRNHGPLHQHIVSQWTRRCHPGRAVKVPLASTRSQSTPGGLCGLSRSCLPNY